MADETSVTPDESRMSRRTALKAAIGVGVGAVAWTGPTITSMAGTPAYAEACTNFTFKFVLTDMATNSSNGCDTVSFQNSPQVDSAIENYFGLSGNETAPYYTDFPNGQLVGCADSETCDDYSFSFPDSDTCTVTIRMYFTSEVGNNPPADASGFVGESTNTGTDGMDICFPEYTGGLDRLDDKSLRWGIWIECFKSSQTQCLPTD